MQPHIMLDLETIATSSNACIVSIGAVLFDVNEVTDEFYVNLSAIQGQQLGFDVDVATMFWWMDQSEEAQNGWRKGDVYKVEQGLHAFSRWVANIKEETGQSPCMWGNGSDFDCVVLGNAYSQTRIGRPWSYSKNRCYRTMKNLCPTVKLDRVGTHHNALDDARSQAEHLIEIWKHLNA